MVTCPGVNTVPTPSLGPVQWLNKRSTACGVTHLSPASSVHRREVRSVLDRAPLKMPKISERLLQIDKVMLRLASFEPLLGLVNVRAPPVSIEMLKFVKTFLLPKWICLLWGVIVHGVVKGKNHFLEPVHRRASFK